MKSAKSKIFSKKIRANSLRMVSVSNSSHIGSCLSVADILAVLFTNILKIFPKDPKNLNRDRLIFSKGHASAIYYAALAESGFFDVKKLKNYCKNNSNLFGHVTKNNIPGVEFSTGSLGHGLPVASGIAFSLKSKKRKNKVYCIISDGECDEGSTWESALFSSHHKLNNLTVIIDHNKIQSFGRVSKILKLKPFINKWKSFNWEVKEVDGHSHSDLFSNLINQKQNKPKVIIAHTIKGKGVPFMEDKLLWHYRSPNSDELVKSLENLK